MKPSCLESGRNSAQKTDLRPETLLPNRDTVSTKTIWVEFRNVFVRGSANHGRCGLNFDMPRSGQGPSTWTWVELRRGLFGAGPIKEDMGFALIRPARGWAGQDGRGPSFDEVFSGPTQSRTIWPVKTWMRVEPRHGPFGAAAVTG